MPDAIFLKELREQPSAVAATLHDLEAQIEALADALSGRIDRLMMVGCGDPYFAAAAALYPFEWWAGLPAEAVDALEFRLWRAPLVRPGTLVIAISQSGKTIQTVESARLARAQGAVVVGITNAPDGPLSADCDHLLLTAGGPSYSFPTRTTTAAAALLFALAAALGRRRTPLPAADVPSHAYLTGALPAVMERALDVAPAAAALAARWRDQEHFAFIGSGPGYAAALVGAAKINETTRLQAEADELEEYGHLHLFGIQRGTPLLFVSPAPQAASRVRAMIEFAVGRDHPVALLTDETTRADWADVPVELIALPAVDVLLSPFVYVLPLQLFAFFLAQERNTDPDRPQGFDNVAIQKMIYTGVLDGWHEGSR